MSLPLLMSVVIGGCWLAAAGVEPADDAAPAAAVGEAAPTDDRVPEPSEGEPSEGEPSEGEPSEAEPDLPEPEPAAPPLSARDPMNSPPSPAGTVAARDDELAPLGDQGASAPPAAFLRRGPFVTVGVGLTHCAQDYCTTIPMGGLGRLELGWRIERIAFVATVTGGGGRADDEDSNEQAIHVLDVAAGLLLLPVREGPVDPFVGASLGYATTIGVLREDSSTTRQVAKRGAVRLSGGILWHATRRIALGPRFDAQLPFAGEWCTHYRDAQLEPFCQSIREDIIAVDDDSRDEVARRRIRRAFPRPWALTLDLRIAI